MRAGLVKAWQQQPPSREKTDTHLLISSVGIKRALQQKDGSYMFLAEGPSAARYPPPAIAAI